MNKIQKIIFFISLSCIFSMKVTKIEPKTVNLGEVVIFTLTVQNYDSSNYFYIGDDLGRSQLFCGQLNGNTLNCQSTIRFYNKDSLSNLNKNLYVNNENTGLTVKINRPQTLKLIGFNSGNVYSYGVSKLYFDVNYNDLYNSNVKIQFGDVQLSECEKSQSSYYQIKCQYAFPESYGGKTLALTFNGQTTSYSISIKTPSVFSTIEYNERDEYYSSSSSQYVYFYVDSSYKMNDNKIVLVSETSDNSNITLTGCTYDEDGIHYAKCSGVLDKNDAYYVYVNNKKTDLKVFVYPLPTAITSVDDIDPSQTLVSTSVTFTLEVSYVVNLDKAVFTLVDKFNEDNKYTLSKCAKVDNYEITCVGSITNPGYYYVYLNGVNQYEYVEVYSQSISKSLQIEPSIIKFNSSSSKSIKVYFDSKNGLSKKSIALKGSSSNAVLEFGDYDSYLIERYYVTFPAADTYYVYIDNVKQDSSYIKVTTESITSKVNSISPTTVSFKKDLTFTLTVDTNLGIEDIDFYLINKNNENDYYLNCKADSDDSTKAICSSYDLDEGSYYVKMDETKFENVVVNAKNVPILNSYSPISIDPSSKKQKINLNFKNVTTDYVSKITFTGNKNIDVSCSSISKYSLSCSGSFKDEDEYYMAIDGANTGSMIKVTDEYNKDEDTDDGVNYVKISSLLFALLLLF